MKKIILISALAVFAIFTITANGNTLNQAQAEKIETKKVVYTCSMHPEVVSDKPGNCPKCGMELEKKTAVKNDSVKNETAKTDSTKMHHSKCCMMH